MHPVPQGLTVHAAGFGRRFAVHAIEHQRKRKYPTRRGTILLSARRLAKLRSREIKSSDRYRRSHRCRSSQRPASSQSFTDLGIPNESQFRAVGISPRLAKRVFRPRLRSANRQPSIRITILKPTDEIASRAERRDRLERENAIPRHSQARVGTELRHASSQKCPRTRRPTAQGELRPTTARGRSASAMKLRPRRVPDPAPLLVGIELAPLPEHL